MKYLKEKILFILILFLTLPSRAGSFKVLLQTNHPNPLEYNEVISSEENDLIHIHGKYSYFQVSSAIVTNHVSLVPTNYSSEELEFITCVEHTSIFPIVKAFDENRKIGLCGKQVKPFISLLYSSNTGFLNLETVAANIHSHSNSLTLIPYFFGHTPLLIDFGAYIPKTKEAIVQVRIYKPSTRKQLLYSIFINQKNNTLDLRLYHGFLLEAQEQLLLSTATINVNSENVPLTNSSNTLTPKAQTPLQVLQSLEYKTSSNTK